MRKFFVKSLFVFVVCIGLLLGLVATTEAQGTPPATPIVSPVVSTPVAVGATPISANPDVVTFAQLQRSEIQLIGPYDSTSFSFYLPAYWKLDPGAELHILLGVSFNTTVQSATNGQIVAGGGTLTATLNGTTLGALPLNDIGETEWNLAIAPSAFTSTSTSGSMVLRFVLNSGLSCLADEHMNVFIHPSSYFTLPHQTVSPATDLTNFPRPIYQNSFIPDSALLVIPDHPTAAEMQSALTVAAGLSNLSANKLILDTTTLGRFRPEQADNTMAENNNIIFIGKTSSLSILSLLHLPLPVRGNQIQTTGSGPDDGYVEMINSPWSASHVILAVTGNTDQGLIKAAQAISTGILRPYRYPNLSIIQEVQSTPISNPQAVDQSLADLGYAGDFFEGRGVNNAFYTFNIPPGSTVSPDAYFDLVYAHSSLLNYDRSGIVVLLNNRPIGSLRLSDTTADQPTNHFRFVIPPSAVVPGRNQLEISTSSVPIDDCTPPGVTNLWFNIWPQSTFHLPLDVAVFNPTAKVDLAQYPSPFTYSQALDSTAFVLPKDDLQAWRSATQIAAYLGSQANGPLTELAVFYGDDVPQTDRAKYNLLVIGRPSQMPFVGEINNSLPAPFSGSSDLATESKFQVTYRIPVDSPLGYVEFLESPWNAGNVILAVLGNEEQGMNWAASALIDPVLRSQLAGNFAVVNNQQILTTDTRTAAYSASDQSTPVPNGLSQTPQSVAANPQLVARPGWVLPVFALTVLLVLLIVAMIVVRGWWRNRHRSPRHEKAE